MFRYILWEFGGRGREFDGEREKERGRWIWGWTWDRIGEGEGIGMGVEILQDITIDDVGDEIMSALVAKDVYGRSWSKYICKRGL